MQKLSMTCVDDSLGEAVGVFEEREIWAQLCADVWMQLVWNIWHTIYVFGSKFVFSYLLMSFLLFSLELVVRSHEVKDEGYQIEHDGKLITVFSAPNYCDQVLKLACM